VSARLRVHTEHWKAKAPFRIAGRTWEGFDLVVCEVRDNGNIGRGEAAGVFYLDETAYSIEQQVAAVARDLHHGLDRARLRELLPPGGARNAVDCALWDLEARRSGRSAWASAGVAPKPVTTVYTIGLEDSPEAMGAKAAAARDRPLLKIKLGPDRPVERLRAVRAARPDAKLIADCNGSWTFEQLRAWAPALRELGLALLEQPLARDADDVLRDYEAPLPLFADESCLNLAELGRAVTLYDGVVIKLDKTGGLTEALQLASAARDAGLRLMVGCMVATSLSMAPAHVLAQHCEFVDIDGPLLLAGDRPNGLRYEGAAVTVPKELLWGSP
jgi:L-Ala-D/L-Glu epimerase